MLSIEKYHHTLQNKHILIGVSGGPDSVCLLHILNSLQKNWNLKLSVAHINYHLRGGDSIKDEHLAKKLCLELNIDFYNLNYLDKKAILKKDENSLRNIRYNFFEKIKKQINADYIAVAHNKDDQVETIIINFIRGSSERGLGGMDYLSENGIIRPFLDAYRSEILEYLHKNKIKYRIDKTNLGEQYLRNKIRNQLIPLLEKEYNPNIKETMIRNSKISKSANGFLKDYSNLILNNISEAKESCIDINYKKWLGLPSIIKAEIIKISIEKIKGDLKDINFAHFYEIILMLENNIPFGEKKIKNLSIKEKYDIIKISKN